MTQPTASIQNHAAETFFFDPLAGLRTDADAAAFQAEAARLAAAAEPAEAFDPLAGLNLEA